MNGNEARGNPDAVLQKNWRCGGQKSRKSNDSGGASTKGKEGSSGTRSQENASRKNKKTSAKNKQIAIIYGLCHATGQVFYVGRTLHPEARLSWHKAKHGSAITMRVLERVAHAGSAAKAEGRWIRHFLTKGEPLLNKVIDVGTPSAKELKIRIARNEKRQFQRQAKYEGLSLSAWMRTHLKVLVRKAAGQKRPITKGES